MILCSCEHFYIVTLGFFDDIFISGQNLQNNSKFDEKEHTWVWEYESEDGKHELFMDTGKKRK